MTIHELSVGREMKGVVRNGSTVHTVQYSSTVQDKYSSTRRDRIVPAHYYVSVPELQRKQFINIKNVIGHGSLCCIVRPEGRTRCMKA